MSDQLSFVWRQLPNLLWGFPSQRPGGLLLTILLSAGAIGVGLILAIGLAAAWTSKFTLVRALIGRFVWVLRSVPLIVLLVLLFQFLGTGAIGGIEFSSLWSAAITLTLYAMAYQADVVRAGIAAVPETLIEDSRVIGATKTQTFLTITLPYALRSMRPALITQAITVFKDSSIVVVLGIADLTTTARIALGGDVANAQFWVATYLTVGALYWGVAFAMSRLAEKRHRNAPSLLGRAHV